MSAHNLIAGDIVIKAGQDPAKADTYTVLERTALGSYYLKRNKDGRHFKRTYHPTDLDVAAIIIAPDAEPVDWT